MIISPPIVNAFLNSLYISFCHNILVKKSPITKKIIENSKAKTHFKLAMVEERSELMNKSTNESVKLVVSKSND